MNPTFAIPDPGTRGVLDMAFSRDGRVVVGAAAGGRRPDQWVEPW